MPLKTPDPFRKGWEWLVLLYSGFAFELISQETSFAERGRIWLHYNFRVVTMAECCCDQWNPWINTWVLSWRSKHVTCPQCWAAVSILLLDSAQYCIPQLLLNSSIVILPLSAKGVAYETGEQATCEMTSSLFSYYATILKYSHGYSSRILEFWFSSFCTQHKYAAATMWKSTSLISPDLWCWPVLWLTSHLWELPRSASCLLLHTNSQTWLVPLHGTHYKLHSKECMCSAVVCNSTFFKHYNLLDIHTLMGNELCGSSKREWVYMYF